MRWFDSARPTKPAHAVRHHVDRLARERLGGIPKHGLEIPFPPIDPARIEAVQCLWPRFADAAVVISQHIEAGSAEKFSEACVISAANRRRRIDNDDRSRLMRERFVLPLEAGDLRSIRSKDLKQLRFARNIEHGKSRPPGRVEHISRKQSIFKRYLRVAR